MSEIDISSIVKQKDLQLTVTTADPTEAAHRRNIELTKESHRLSELAKSNSFKRTRDAIILALGIILVTCIFIYSGLVLANGNSTQEAKTIATATIPAILTGFMGYLTGRSSKSDDEGK